MHVLGILKGCTLTCLCIHLPVDVASVFLTPGISDLFLTDIALIFTSLRKDVYVVTESAFGLRGRLDILLRRGSCRVTWCKTARRCETHAL